MKIYSGNKLVIDNVKVCNGIKSFIGLRFSKQLKENEAVLIEGKDESIIDSTIDMLFVFFPIDVIWLDKNKKIVDMKKNVKPFSLFSAPRKAAKYIIEVKKGVGDKFKINEKFRFV
ncbi:MAG TPA: DUF192 domain-containing protein [Candidatus Nanoarchaeia archaeon]|nr:DUF192 domain-containing protein [Candidatus Nanoarchaeia archaeon]